MTPSPISSETKGLPISTSIDVFSKLTLNLGSMNQTVTSETASEQSESPLLKDTSGIKGIWARLKDENQQRKDSIKHVTPEEAKAVTGYGKDGPTPEKQDALGKGSKGDKSIAAAMLLS
ncbi:hypothetical protein N0V90_009065 [Kalmusia sp. IMI 367209]|nr:hypothetical protein N0V90_009065 [Kalmusia sp. IMI 367209]